MHDCTPTCGRARTPMRPARPGFALMVALSLMGFIVLLLFSLSTVTRIETQSASAGISGQLARQNALVGLQVALGQLQKYAGPDQRATATAEILEKSSQKPLKQNFHWTGVWNSDPGDDFFAANSNNRRGDPRATENDYGKLVGWLISGKNPQPQQPIAGYAQTGGSSTGTVRLVGAKTVSKSDNYVDAGLVPLGASNARTGAFAWWVGDEGVKAKVNLVDSYTNTSKKEDRTFRQQFPQRVGSEFIFPNLSSVTTDKSLRDMLSRTKTYNSIATLSQIGATKAKENYFFATPYSKSVLCDVRRGGLKQDLSVAMYTYSDSEFNNKFIRKQPLGRGYQDSARDMIFPPQFTASPGDLDPGGPKWLQARDFARWHKNSNNVDSVTLTGYGNNAKPTDEKNMIAPVIAYMHIGFTVAAYSTGPTTYGFRLYYAPALALWNPYNRTMTSSQTLNFELGVGKNLVEQIKFKTSVSKKDVQAYSGSSALTAANYIRFKIDNLSLAPGECKVYTPQKTGKVAGMPFTLTPGWRPNARIYLGDFVFKEGSKTYDAKAEFANLSQLSYTTNKGGSTGTIRIYLGSADANSAGTQGRLLYSDSSMKFYAGDAVSGASIEVLNGSGADPVSPPVSGHYYLLRMMDNKLTGSLAAAVDTAYSRCQKTSPLAHTNPRAAYHAFTGPEDSGDNTLVYNTGVFGYGVNTTKSTAMADLLKSVAPSSSGGSSMPIGVGISHAIDKAALFDLPTEDLVSVGQFMHANLQRAKDWDVNLPKMPGTAKSYFAAQTPAYAVGNSLAPVPVRNNKIFECYDNQYPYKSTGGKASPRGVAYDTSYLLNDALWDSYFFSSVENPVKLPLKNMRYDVCTDETTAKEALKDHAKSAGALLLDGGFNVNSTSVEAWKAVLGSLKNVRGDRNTPVFRYDDDVDNFNVRTASYKVDDSRGWTGVRSLTDREIETLAQKIVDGIKDRRSRAKDKSGKAGVPFLSLSEFVNRTPASTKTEDRLKGILQEAIDATDINKQFTSDTNWVPYEYSGSLVTRKGPPPGNYDVQNIRENLAVPQAFGVPGFVMQADVLNRIGATLTTRSDTFVIRAYGDARTSGGGKVASRAYCEAVVQRVPDYVDAGTSSKAIGPETALSSAGALNQALGRRFKIVSFRWLTSDDL